MPFLEYMLLAILGAAPAATVGGMPSGATPGRTITADCLTQPGGGTVGDPSVGIALAGQDTAGCHGRKLPTTGRKPLEHARSSRHHRRGHRHTKTGGDPDRPSHRQPQVGVGATRR
jgi:hypothetical protein